MHWESLSEDGGETVVLKRFRGSFDVKPPPDEAERVRRGAVLDCETTGVDPERDSVIEIGLRTFDFDRATGDVVGLAESYDELEDPGVPIPPEITRLTGITDDDVRGKVIDWAKVAAMLEQAQVVIAHNARFDRRFVDPRIGQPRKVWACSHRLLGWRGRGFPSGSLEVLAVWHGFYARSHRALADADALLHLLTHPAAGGERSYLAELLEAARQPVVRVFASWSPYETKDALRQRGYRWDRDKRVWWTELDLEREPDERAWLASNVYDGVFRGDVERISPYDRFR